MTYIKIKETLYPAEINGRMSDTDWDNRASKAITLEMTHAQASALFVDGAAWSIITEQDVPVYETNENGEPVLDELGNPEVKEYETQETEFDNSDYCLAGDITDHRDGRITVKMGALTEVEQAYELMLGGM